jgi:hypothetical protein
MRFGWMTAAAALMVAGCGDHATLTPANPQAQAAGAGRMDYTGGVGGGFMRIVLATGEVFPGTFTISETKAQDNFSATAHNSRTTLTCHGTMVAGHGKAQCQGTDGSVYDMTI